MQCTRILVLPRPCASGPSSLFPAELGSGRNAWPSQSKEGPWNDELPFSARVAPFFRLGLGTWKAFPPFPPSVRGPATILSDSCIRPPPLYFVQTQTRRCLPTGRARVGFDSLLFHFTAPAARRQELTPDDQFLGCLNRPLFCPHEDLLVSFPPPHDFSFVFWQSSDAGSIFISLALRFPPPLASASISIFQCLTPAKLAPPRLSR